MVQLYCQIRQTDSRSGYGRLLGLVVSDVLNAQELEDLKQDLAVMAECNGAVVRVTLLDQNMAVETAHLMDAKDCNAAEGAGSNRQDLALCNVGRKLPSLSHCRR